MASVKPDENTNCLSNIARKTVIVIDRSDDTPKQTVAEIAARIRNYVSSSAQENELVSIFEVTANAYIGVPPGQRSLLSPSGRSSSAVA